MLPPDQGHKLPLLDRFTPLVVDPHALHHHAPVRLGTGLTRCWRSPIKWASG